MRMRRITSLAALLVLAILSGTGIILYIVPKDSVAFWIDWHFLALTKNQWVNMHIISGASFLFLITLHVFYNWKPIFYYTLKKSKRHTSISDEFGLAIFLSLLVFILALLELPPANWIINFSDSIKDNASQKYADIPYGFAQHSSMTAFLIKTGYNQNKAMYRLKKAGISFESPVQTIGDIVSKNNISPQDLLRILKPTDFSEKPTIGFGKRVLIDVCNDNELNFHLVINELLKNKINASFDMTIREIAEKNNLTSSDIYQIIKNYYENKKLSDQNHSARPSKSTAA